jgi:hypothetical protein
MRYIPVTLPLPSYYFTPLASRENCRAPREVNPSIFPLRLFTLHLPRPHLPSLSTQLAHLSIFTRHGHRPPHNLTLCRLLNFYLSKVFDPASPVALSRPTLLATFLLAGTIWSSPPALVLLAPEPMVSSLTFRCLNTFLGFMKLT